MCTNCHFVLFQLVLQCLSDADKSCFGSVPGRVKLCEFRRLKFANNTNVFCRFVCFGMCINCYFWLISICFALFERRRQIVLNIHICARYICDCFCYIFFMFFMVLVLGEQNCKSHEACKSNVNIEDATWRGSTLRISTCARTL